MHIIENELTAEQFCNLYYPSVIVGLMAAKGKEPFYIKSGFRIRPNEKEGSGMMLNYFIEETGR